MTTRLERKSARLAESVGARISRRDIADALGVTVRTIDRWIAAGRLPAPDVKFSRKTHRWRMATIQPFLEGGSAQT